MKAPTVPVGDERLGAGGPSTEKLIGTLHVAPASFFACTDQPYDPRSRTREGVHEQAPPAHNCPATAPPWNTMVVPSPTCRKYAVAPVDSLHR
jgi:hypothetical protein